ncbi:hypothetical protein [Chelativorans salis]|uniref:Uncharacterized protein n=1 Tax=Chelativorans salis TaxID=2978478 RepID=A0ABT2LRG3_9HYPH|nr:hypothetical protein [Chelativorans sp. EGI FJ00035]MCT7377136.1 hypothetical protein [Chelativorans sp. EGI FJ00035]
MALTQQDFDTAKQTASSLSEALRDVPLLPKHYGISIYLAADIAANAPTKHQAEKMLKAFLSETRHEMEGMLSRLGKS